MTWRAWAIGLSVLLSVGACSRLPRPPDVESASPRPTATAAEAVRGPQPTPGKVMLGAFVQLTGETTKQSVERRRGQLGRDFRILHWFYEWDDALPAQIALLPPGSIVLMSWRGTSYASIEDGSQDAWIAKQADRIRAYRHPVFLRWGWEMNGDWYPWSGAENGGDPRGYVAAWRHIHSIFALHHVTNVSWVWAPNWESVPNEPWNRISNYYPGDAYVDWVGVSGYSNGYTPPGKIFDPIYNEFAERKPIMVAEAGVRDRGGSTKPDWIAALATWVKTSPAVAALCWYDTDQSPGTPENYRIDSTPASLAAFRELARDPYFDG